MALATVWQEWGYKCICRNPLTRKFIFLQVLSNEDKCQIRQTSETCVVHILKRMSNSELCWLYPLFNVVAPKGAVFFFLWLQGNLFSYFSGPLGQASGPLGQALVLSGRRYFL